MGDLNKPCCLGSSATEVVELRYWDFIILDPKINSSISINQDLAAAFAVAVSAGIYHYLVYNVNITSEEINKQQPRPKSTHPNIIKPKIDPTSYSISAIYSA